MILQAVILHHGKDHLEAVVENEGQLQRIALSWFAKDHVLSPDWFKTVEGEARAQQAARSQRAAGREPL